METASERGREQHFSDEEEADEVANEVREQLHEEAQQEDDDEPSGSV